MLSQVTKGSPFLLRVYLDMVWLFMEGPDCENDNVKSNITVPSTETLIILLMSSFLVKSALPEQ